MLNKIIYIFLQKNKQTKKKTFADFYINYFESEKTTKIFLYSFNIANIYFILLKKYHTQKINNLKLDNHLEFTFFLKKQNISKININ